MLPTKEVIKFIKKTIIVLTYASSTDIHLLSNLELSLTASIACVNILLDICKNRMMFCKYGRLKVLFNADIT